MAVAMAYPEPEKGGRGKKALNNSTVLGFDKALLSNARFVLRVTPTVAQSVIAGEKPLAVAYDEAKVIESERAEFTRKLMRLKSKRWRSGALPMSTMPPRIGGRFSRRAGIEPNFQKRSLLRRQPPTSASPTRKSTRPVRSATPSARLAKFVCAPSAAPASC